MTKKTSKERLAKAAHDIWAHWMRYFFSVGYEDVLLHLDEVRKSGEKIFVTHGENVERWKRQMNTEFKDLPEGERKSDYDIAEQYLKPIIDELIAEVEEMQWISVDERLPEGSGIYLTWVDHKEISEKAQGAMRLAFDVNRASWENDLYRYMHVTHWMPLPPAPDTKEE